MTTPSIRLQENGTVQMRIYPHTDMLVEVARPAAVHLFSLVCRYNATLATPRWTQFWRRITQVERSMTVLFVEANGAWGQRIPMTSLFQPAAYQSTQGSEFRSVLESGRRRTLTESVEKEFLALYRVHVMATVPKDTVLATWQTQFPKIVALLHDHGALEKLLEEERCYDELLVFAVVHDLLLKHGRDVVQGGKNLSHEDWCWNDAQLFAGCIIAKAA